MPQPIQSFLSPIVPRLSESESKLKNLGAVLLLRNSTPSLSWNSGNDAPTVPFRAYFNSKIGAILQHNQVFKVNRSAFPTKNKEGGPIKNSVNVFYTSICSSAEGCWAHVDACRLGWFFPWALGSVQKYSVTILLAAPYGGRYLLTGYGKSRQGWSTLHIVLVLATATTALQSGYFCVALAQ